MNPKRAPKLFIGPWIGEFGVELLRWQSIARTLAKSREWAEIIVATHPDRFFLYEDFASKFVPYVPHTIHTVGFGCKGHRGETIHERYIDEKQGDVWLNPQIEADTEKHYYPISGCRSTYRNFAAGTTAPKKRFDVLLHARATGKASQQFKNWSNLHFNAVVEALPNTWRIASTGSVTGAHKIKGTDDLRGIPLKELAAYCQTAKLVVGPSSGTIHYAMHCGAPVVTWIGQDDRYNYFPVWNPWDTPVCCLPGWQPEPDVVAHKIIEMRKLLESRLHPIEFLVAGSICSGYRPFIEWLAALLPQTRITSWNTCETEGMTSYPELGESLPSRHCVPKTLHRPALSASISEFNTQGRHAARIMSFQGVGLHHLARQPEAAAAKRIVVVVRDLANTAASMKRDEHALRRESFLDANFRHLIRSAKEYLLEAVGRTQSMTAISKKTVFVSYNRWHTDMIYRRQIAAALGIKVSQGVSDLGFATDKLPAHETANNTRWRQFAADRRFWNLICDPGTYELEQAFHGKAMADYGKIIA